MRHDAFEAAKWVALVTMTIDHYGKIVDPSLLLVTHCVGRLSFPLFAGIVGMRLALSPGLSEAYLKRLAFWAVVSQPVFVLAGRPWSDGNILFTLLLGVAASDVLAQWESSAASVALLAFIAAAASRVEFGVGGVAMVPIVARIASVRPTTALWLIGPIGVLANVVFEVPPFVASDLFALGATPVAFASARLGGNVPRIPKYFFYAYYPLHLYALHRLDLYLKS